MPVRPNDAIASRGTSAPDRSVHSHAGSGPAAARAPWSVKRHRPFLSCLKGLGIDIRILPGGLYRFVSRSIESRPLAELLHARAQFTRQSKALLRDFLDRGETLELARPTKPKVSILCPAFNKAHLTYVYLLSLHDQDFRDYELLFLDNDSSDDTPRLLERFRNVRAIRSPANIGYLRAINLLAEQASAPLLLLSNNDTVFLPGSIAAAVGRMEATPQAGAVGAKLILPNGRLQEAGSLIAVDGHCRGIGRYLDPDDPAFGVSYEVHYSSAAALLVRKALFDRLGGYDRQFEPAYYEDADLCLQLRALGYATVYEPRFEIIHFEFGSRETPAFQEEIQKDNRLKFARKNRAILQDLNKADPEPATSPADVP